MNTQGKLLRLGAAAILCVLVIQLLSSAGVPALMKNTQIDRLGAILLFMHTGRMVRTAEPTQQTEPANTPTQPSAETPEPTQRKKTPAQLTGTDSELVAVKDQIGCDIDIDGLLQKELSWDLTGEEAAVLILHTHGSESYKKTEDYEESSAYRTLDEDYNVVSVGDRVAALLEEAGIRVIHDRTLHDHPSYSGSYEQARKSMQAYLEQYPSIRLVLDIHRDAAEDSTGQQIDYTVSTPKGAAAQIMLVVGSNAGGLEHPGWQENLALGAKVQVQLEKLQPGICRPISLRTSRFNQDLSAGALLVEMGAAGNTRQEALLAAEVLAEAIIELSYGAVYQ